MEDFEKILEKANYCFGCPEPRCKNLGCPMKTRIPEFIECIKNNNLQEAYNILKENNICTHICSIICPQEEQCEGSCIRGIKDSPTSIGELERYVNEWAEENNIKYQYNVKEKINKKVAIVGSGPAGIACARELLISGIDVDIYEKEPYFGGLLEYGIPDFRLDKKYVREIENELISLGANIYYRKELGKDIRLRNLKEQYDYVFLGIGAGVSSTYALHSEKNNRDIPNVFDSNMFLKAYHDEKTLENLGEVVVIGGGNVAMDCARVAVRMGADHTTILYRRNRDLMPARHEELDEALADGVEFKELVRVESGNIDEFGKITSLNCVRTEILEGIACDKVPEERFVEKANTVVFAIGLKPNKSLLETEFLKMNFKGNLDLDESGKTSDDNVYAGGDVAGRVSTVCHALAGGKKAAQTIIKKLMS